MRVLYAIAAIIVANGIVAGFAGSNGAGNAAWAHEIRPAIVSITISPQRQFGITVSTNLEALVAEIGAEHDDTDESPKAARYNALRALSADELANRFTNFADRWLEGLSVKFGGRRVRPKITSLDIPETGDIELARISKVHLNGAIPSGARNIQWAYAGKYGSSVLRVTRPGDTEPVTSWLKDGAVSKLIPLSGRIEKSTISLLWDYIVVGFTHIIPKGLDHILFVLGLYLLSVQWRPLLMQVTAFTVAHSITLAMGVYGVLEISPNIVEPLIALSIVYVAVENIMTARLSPWRPFVIFGFGLLHGLGFAGVLREIGLPRADFVTGLVGFNLGVEFGQLAVIALAFLATGLWFRGKSWYRSAIVIPGSIAIALVGLYWSVERIFLT